MLEWISVKDRLPEPEKEKPQGNTYYLLKVVGLNHGNGLVVGRYLFVYYSLSKTHKNPQFRFHPGIDEHKGFVSHWMPCDLILDPKWD